MAGGTRHRRRHAKSRRTRRVRGGVNTVDLEHVNDPFKQPPRPQYENNDNFSIQNTYKVFHNQPCHMPSSLQLSTNDFHHKCKNYFDFKLQHLNQCRKAKALVHRQRKLGCATKKTSKGWW